MGSAAVNFALVWWLTAKTGSAVILAYASIAAILPQAILGPLVGPFIDRWDRRVTMIGADLFVAATSVVLIGVFAKGEPPVASVVAVIAARAVGAAFHTPASQAAVPMYVPAEHLMRVAGWNFFLGSGVAMAGPVLGALLMGVAPMAAVISIDVAGALLAVVSLVLVKIPNPQKPQSVGAPSGLLAEFVDGWHELVRNRGLLELTLIATVVTLFYMPLNALFPLMTFVHFGGDAVSASVTELAFGAGMLLGSLMIGLLSTRASAVRLIGLGIAVVGVTIGISGVLPSSGFWVFVGLCIVTGWSAPLFGAPLAAMFQTLIDPSKLGRVMSLYITMTMLVAPVGLLVAGPVAERIGVATWFAISGVLIFLAGIWVWTVPAIRHLEAAMREAVSRSGAIGSEPELSLESLPD